MRLFILTAAAVVAVVAVVLISGDSDSLIERQDIAVQGPSDEVYAANGATLERRSDGVTGHAVLDTPEPGSYDYPTRFELPPWALPHPEVHVAGDGETETFTMWIVIFNHPQHCTDGDCGVDDFGDEAEARGGVFQADGRIADGDTLEMAGTVRLGQVPMHGWAFENPLGAEIHFAIAPHGKALTGEDLWRQLNGPVGNPSFWWSAAFFASESA